MKLSFFKERDKIVFVESLANNPKEDRQYCIYYECNNNLINFEIPFVMAVYDFKNKYLFVRKLEERE